MAEGSPYDVTPEEQRRYCLFCVGQMARQLREDMPGVTADRVVQMLVTGPRRLVMSEVILCFIEWDQITEADAELVIRESLEQ